MLHIKKNWKARFVNSGEVAVTGVLKQSVSDEDF